MKEMSFLRAQFQRYIRKDILVVENCFLGQFRAPVLIIYSHIELLFNINLEKYILTFRTFAALRREIQGGSINRTFFATQFNTTPNIVSP